MLGRSMRGPKYTTSNAKDAIAGAWASSLEEDIASPLVVDKFVHDPKTDQYLLATSAHSRLSSALCRSPRRSPADYNVLFDEQTQTSSMNLVPNSPLVLTTTLGSKCFWQLSAHAMRWMQGC